MRRFAAIAVLTLPLATMACGADRLVGGPQPAGGGTSDQWGAGSDAQAWDSLGGNDDAASSYDGAPETAGADIPILDADSTTAAVDVPGTVSDADAPDAADAGDAGDAGGSGDGDDDAEPADAAPEAGGGAPDADLDGATDGAGSDGDDGSDDPLDGDGGDSDGAALGDGDSGAAGEVDAAPDASPPPDPSKCPYGLSPKAVGCRVLGPCAATVQLACQGTKPVCDYSAFAAFEPYELSCDGIDNDCNGKTDDNLAKPPAKGWPDVGVCLFATKVCHGAAGWQGPQPADIAHYEAAEQSCDGLDNDCDGKTDVIAAAPPAGAAAGVCAQAKLICSQGAWINQSPQDIPGFEPIEKSCDGLDNDCDGQTDEALLAPPGVVPGLLQLGVCAGAAPVCGSGTWKAPDYKAYTASLPAATTATYEVNEASCDGLDNDCDGQTDEALAAPAAAKQGGVCKGAVKACYGAIGWGEPTYGTLPGYAAGSETTCDGIDNNCDGATDEAALCPLWARGGGGSGAIALRPGSGLVALARRTAVSFASPTAKGGIAAHVADVALGHRFDHGAEIEDLAFAPDGSVLASVGRDQVLRLLLWPAAGPIETAPLLAAVDAPGQRWRRVRWDLTGGRLAIGDEAGFVRIVQSPTAKPLVALLGHEAPIDALDWQRAGPGAGQHVISGDTKGRLRRWSVLDGGHTLWVAAGPAVTALAASTKAPLVAVGHGDGALVVRHVATGAVVAALALGAGASGAGSGVHSLLWDDEGGVWAARGDGKVLRALTADDGKSLQLATTLPPPGDWQPGELAGTLQWVATPSGATLFLGSRQGPARWRPAAAGDWQPIDESARGPLHALRAAPTTAPTLAGVLASAHGDGAVRLRRGWDGAPLATLVGHTLPVQALAWRGQGPADTPHLATGGGDGAVRLWSLQAPAKPLAPWPASAATNGFTFGVGGGWPLALAYAADGKWLWVGGQGLLRAHEVHGDMMFWGKPALVFALPLLQAAAAVEVASDGRVAVGLLEAEVAARIYAADGAPLADIAALPATTRALRWGPPGGGLAISGGPARLQVVDGNTGKIVHSLPGHLAEVAAIAWADSGLRLLSGDAGGQARLWHHGPAGWATVAVLTRHAPTTGAGAAVQGVAFLDGGGTVFVTAGSDGGLIGWRRP